MGKFGFSSKKNFSAGILLSTAALVLLGTLVYSLYRGAGLFKQRADRLYKQVSIATLWEEEKYHEIAKLAEEKLITSPLDHDALLYAGYSYFILAISRLSTENRNADLDLSVRYLRRLRNKGGTPHPERVDYVLGKAYFMKGFFWADLALAYLESSLDSGYQAEDSYEFLGRTHSILGDVEKALYWYELAAQIYPTDRLFLILGEEAFELGRYDDAADYYQRTIDNTKDETLRKSGLSQLGQLYYDVKNYSMAKKVFEELVSLEPLNKDYQFLLGEVYYALGNIKEARNAWFAVTRIDPQHYEALSRLYD